MERLFVSAFPEVSLEQVTTSGGSSSGVVGTFRVSRTGDISQALTGVFEYNDQHPN